MFDNYPYGQPWPHQVRGAQAIVDRVRPAGTLLPHPVGWGKSLTTIAAAYELYRRREVNTVFVVSPAYARSVWADPDPLLGEFGKWPAMPVDLHEFCARTPVLPAKPGCLQVVVTNYELIRRPAHRDKVFLWLRQRRPMLVIDESWNVFDPTSQQSEALTQLAAPCSRVVLLNGTPGKPEQVYGQINVISTTAYPVKNIFHWKKRYALMGGYGGKQIVGYREDTTPERVAIESQYVVPILETDKVDMPDWMPSVTIIAELTNRTWDLYRQMRDDFIAQIDDGRIASAATAGTKYLRLQQILAGFVGGVECDDETDQDYPKSTVQEIGDEKQRALLAWIDSNETHKSILWGRFRPEMLRLAIALRQRGERVFMLWGKDAQTPQKRHDDERRQLKTVFAPGSPDRDRAWIVGHTAAGGAALNFSGADLAIYASPAPSCRTRTQADGRVRRPGQLLRPRRVEIIAVGPQGQKTVDHSIIAALRKDQEIADWTAAQWRAAVAVE